MGYRFRNREKTKQPSMEKLIKALDDYREQLHKAKTVKSTQFMHMQTALFHAKNIIRVLHNQKPKSAIAWIK